MEIFESNFNIDKYGPCVLALGNFDGVHIGHTSLFEKAREYAEVNNIFFGVYTFLDAPKFKNAHRSILTDTQDRLSLIGCLSDCDFLYFEHFDDVKDFSPEEFVDFIIEKFGCVCCVCGENFSFGKCAAGNSHTLELLMKQRQKDCIIVNSKMYKDNVVSSTLIKDLISEGDVETVCRLMKPYGFTSKVLHGEHIGHSLGFPTVNQIIPEKLVEPKFGVYATLVVVDGKEYLGVTNFGIKPTVSGNNSQPRAETFIVDYECEIYGRYVGLYFLKMLREEKRFSSLDELKENIALDVEKAKLYYKELKVKNEA